MSATSSRAVIERFQPGPLLKPITGVLAVGLLVQMLTALLPGHGADMLVLSNWARDLATLGPPDFYDEGYPAEYFPGYLYALWGIGLANDWLGFSEAEFDYVLKMSSVIVNLASACLLYVMLEGKREWMRLLAPAIYLLLPTTLFIGPLWGQVDAIPAFFLLLSVYFMSRDRPLVAAAVFVVAFMVKPQAVGAVLVLAFWGIRDHPPRVWGQAAAVAGLTGLFLVLPFFPTEPWRIFGHAEHASELYPFNSSFGFNFWGMWGWFRSDAITHWGIEWRIWGFALVIIANLAIIWVLRDRQGAGWLALGVALAMLAFFLFMTRMQERYLFLTFLPLLAAVFLLNSRVLAIAFIVLSIIHFLGLYFAFYHPNFNPEFEPGWLYTRDIIRMIDYSPSGWTRPGSFAALLISSSAIATFVAILCWVGYNNWKWGGLDRPVDKTAEVAPSTGTAT